MTESNTQDALSSGVLFELYARYAGEPDSRLEVYGYWLFIAGAVSGFLGVLLFVVGPTNQPPLSVAFLVREVAITLASLGLAVTLFGILLLFPLRRTGIYAAVAGTVVAVCAVVGFVVIYPANWVGRTPDHSDLVIAVYSVGIAVDVAVAGLVPVATGERSYFFEETYEREEEYPDVMVGEALRGGLFSVYRTGEEWAWRLVEQEALVGARGMVSRIGTEEAVERVKERVGEARLMEIQNAAFRLYEAAEGQWRWVLMRADGTVVADSDGAADRESAERSVNELKELGPSATLLRIEGAALDYYTEGGEWRWRLVDEDRRPIAEGGEGHDSRAEAEAAAETVRERAGEASVLTIEAFGVELFEDDGWRWRLLDADETEIAAGTETFDSRRAAESAVYDLLEGLADAPVIVRGEPGYEVTPAGGGWRWQLVAGDQRVVARSHDTAPDADTAEQRASRMAADAADAGVVVAQETEFEYYPGGDGWQWRLVTEDRETIAESARDFEDRAAAEAAIDDVRTQATEAELIEYEDAAFQVYETGGEWRWRLIDEDGNVMTDSGAQHESRDEATTSMMTVKENAPNADVLEIETAAFELFERDGEWNWRLVDAGGETTARGTRWHDSRAAAREAMDRLTDRAPESRDRSMEGAVFQLYAADDWHWRFVRPDGTVLADGAANYGTRDEVETAIEEEVREVATTPTVHRIESVAVQLLERGESWGWRLLDADREALATGSQSFPSRSDAEETVSTLQRRAAETTVFERKETTFLLAGVDGEWRWKLAGADRRALATGPGTHDSRRDAEAAVDRVRSLFPEAGTIEYEDAAFELYEAEGRWHWRLVDEDDATIAAGTEGYDSREAAAEGVRAVQREVADASIFEVDTAVFEIHQDDGEWRWRLVDGDGTTLAESLTAYPTRGEARESMDTVKEFAPESMTRVAE